MKAVMQQHLHHTIAVLPIALRRLAQRKGVMRRVDHHQLDAAPIGGFELVPVNMLAVIEHLAAALLKLGDLSQPARHLFSEHLSTAAPYDRNSGTIGTISNNSGRLCSVSPTV